MDVPEVPRRTWPIRSNYTLLFPVLQDLLAFLCAVSYTNNHKRRHPCFGCNTGIDALIVYKHHRRSVRMRIQLTRKPVDFVIPILGAILVVGAGVFASLSMQRASYADAVPESCFLMDEDDTGRIIRYNLTNDPLCVSDVTIPSTINGQTVTTISSGIFTDTTITSVVLPDTITNIESGALTSHYGNVTLSTLEIDVSGDLTIGSGALDSSVTGAVSIHADGDLTYNDNSTGSLASLTISAGGSITVPTSTSGSETIDTLSISGGDTVTIGGGALSGRTFGAVSLHSDADLIIESGALSSDIDELTMTSGQSLSVTASIYAGLSSSELSVGSMDIVAGTSLSIGASSFSRLTDMTSVSLSAGTGLVNMHSSALCDNDMTSLSISAPAGLTITGTALCNLPQLTTVTFPVLAGDVYISGGFNNAALTDFTLSTHGSFTATDAAFTNSAALISLDINVGGDLTLTNGSFEDNLSLESIALSGNSVTVENNALTGIDAASLSLEIIANEDVAFGSGSLSHIASLSTVTVDAGADIFITNGAFASMNGLRSISFIAGNDITLSSSASGFLNGYAATTTISLEAERDLNFGTTNNSNIFNLPLLTNLSLSAGRDALFGYNMLSNLPALTSLTLDLQRHFTIGSASLNNLPSLTSLSIVAPTGDITFVGGGILVNLSLLESLELYAAGNISLNAGIATVPVLEDIRITAGGDITMTPGAATRGLFKNVALSAGDTINLMSAFLESESENVSMDATGAISVDDSFSQASLLAQLSINSATSTTISNTSFSGTRLDAAYITSPSTSILGSAFSRTGVILDTDTHTWDNTGLRFLPIYVNNAGSLTDMAYINATTLVNDGGGYLINPVQLTIRYVNDSNDTIGTETTLLGVHADGTPVMSYLVSDNPESNFDLYFKDGDSYTFAPPTIAGYETPTTQTLTIDADNNTFSVEYAALTNAGGNGSTDDSTAVGSPNTGLVATTSAAITQNQTTALPLLLTIAITAGILCIASVLLIVYRAKS